MLATRSQATELKARFARKLWQLDEQSQADALAHTRAALESEAALARSKQDADKALADAAAMSDLELRVDNDLNDEEIKKVSEEAQKLIDDKDSAYMRLLAKHTLASGMAAKAGKDHEALRIEAEALRKENARLADQAGALQDELDAMQVCCQTLSMSMQ